MFGENPTISVIELYVRPYDAWGGHHSGPEEAVFSDLAAGRVLGLGLVIYDWDEDEWAIPWTAQNEGLAPADDIYLLRADYYLDGLLLSADPTEPESAVESITWGRIKAALEIDLTQKNGWPVGW